MNVKLAGPKRNYTSLVASRSILVQNIKSSPRGEFARCLLVDLKAPRANQSQKDMALLCVDGFMANLTEGCFLELVATFEKVAYDWLTMACGDLASIAKDKYPQDKHYACVSDALVCKVDKHFSRLSELKRLVEAKLDKQTKAEFKKIIEYRNFIAHGKRFQKEATPVDFLHAHGVLSQVLGVIEGG